ncbi:MAG: ATP-binding protein [Deltaproteobacteria bacterium]|nr:ATP-binding protein [Deltaproteobacteria bacterium]
MQNLPVPLASKRNEDMRLKLKWLMLARVLFTTLLLGSTVVLQLGVAASPLAPGLLVLYGLIASIFCMSFFYTLLLGRVGNVAAFTYVQIGLDTVIVSLIIYVTGNYSSIFSFLYLVVIIYSSMLLYRSGSMVISMLCSAQYAFLVILEYNAVLKPFALEDGLLAGIGDFNQVFYKILITIFGCFAVAFLSSLLAEQARKSRKELWAMEDQVRRVEKMAAVGEMAAGLAHEIKNPLASMTGSIQILRDGVRLDPDHARLMHIVLREADRLSALVNNFLLFARPPAGKIERIALDKAVGETVELFERDRSCRGRICIRKDFKAGLLVEMDQVHLHQVLWNLLLNASEAINGSGTIAIRLYPTKLQGACVEVSDDGCGMSNDTIKSIFDPFFTTKPNGTGLGLSIVHSIIESYGSRLEVGSRLGAGTTFSFCLKRIDPSTGA